MLTLLYTQSRKQITINMGVAAHFAVKQSISELFWCSNTVECNDKWCWIKTWYYLIVESSHAIIIMWTVSAKYDSQDGWPILTSHHHQQSSGYNWNTYIRTLWHKSWNHLFSVFMMFDKVITVLSTLTDIIYQILKYFNFKELSVFSITQYIHWGIKWSF